eukprot:TCONS_00017129-protein
MNKLRISNNTRQKWSAVALGVFCACLFMTMALSIKFKHHGDMYMDVTLTKSSSKAVTFLDANSNVIVKVDERSSLDTERLRNETSRLQRLLNDVQKNIARMKESRKLFNQTPSKALAKIKTPDSAMVYENQDFLLCGRQTLKLMVLVLTGHEEKDAREKFRNVWSKTIKEASKEKNIEIKWRMVFVIGRDHGETASDVYHINEAIFKRDMVNIHALNTHTMGALYGALHWVHNGCFYENLLVIRPHMVPNMAKMYVMLQDLNRLSHQNYFIRETVQDLTDAYQSTALLISRSALQKALPLMKIHTGSVSPINYDVLLRYVEYFKSKNIRYSNFMSESKCEFQNDYVISVMPHSMCLDLVQYQIMDNANKTLS